MTGLRLLTFLLTMVVLCGVAPKPVQAQLPFVPGMGTAATQNEEADEETAPTATQGETTRALIEVLRDDDARSALLAELERIAAGRDARPETDPAGNDVAEPEDEAESISVSRQLAIVTREIALGVRDEAVGFFNAVRMTNRRLSLLWGPRAGNLIEPLQDIVLILVGTIAVYALLRSMARRLYLRIETALSGTGLIGRSAALAAAVVLDLAAIVVTYLPANALLLLRHGEANAGALTQTLYLNAFVVVEIGKVALATVLAPRRPRIRLVPFADATARYWFRYGRILLGILGYGLLLVVPIINQSVSIFTGRAVTVVIYAVVLLWAMALVLINRRRPAAYFAGRMAASDGDMTLRLMAALALVWHWPVLVYLLMLFVVAVTAPLSLGPLLLLSGRVVLVLAVGAGIGALLARTAKRGIVLPELMREPLPMLEQRLNDFFQSLLGLMRLVIFVVTVTTALRVAGIADIPAWLNNVLGRDLTASLFSVLFVAIVAFLLWLLLASWVDYRLNPNRGIAPTAREATLLTLMRNALTVAIVVIALMVSLSELGLEIGPLLASAGVLGLAISFGSQRLVQDIITGVFIQLENAFNVGDVVTVAGTTGVVEKLTIRSVSLRDLSGVFHIIPFSSVDMVSNLMRDFSFHVAEIGIAYRESVDEAKALMFLAFDDLRADPVHGPAIIGPLDWHGVTEFGDSQVTVRARIRTRPGSHWAIGRAYNELVKRRFDEAGVEIPFPHMTVWFGEDKAGKAPPLRVAASQGPRSRRSDTAPLSPPPFGQDAPNEDED